jgi:DNA-binding winged helix-turn-helix (wHTH) protein
MSLSDQSRKRVGTLERSQSGSPHELRKFSKFTVNLTTDEILSNGRKVGMEFKVFQMLGLLLRSPGQLVTFDQLKTVIWPDVTVELKENCHVLANKLRAALGEAEVGEPYVLNERGKGYRFNREVSVECLILPPPKEGSAQIDCDALPQVDHTWRMSVWRWSAALVVVLILSGLCVTLWPQAQVHDFRIQGRDVVALDAKDRQLWRHSFPVDLLELEYVGDKRRRHSWVGQLTQSGAPQLLFNVFPIQNITFGSPVVLFRPDGKVAWEFTPGRPVIDGSGQKMLPPYHPNSVVVMPGNRADDTRIVISSNHYLGQANQVAFLNVRGQVIGEYWHPGHLLHLNQKDLDGDGRNELLLGGVNNGNRQATLVILDPLKIVGISTPQQVIEHRFELIDMPASFEKAVVLFPRSCISKGQPYTRVTALDVTSERIKVDVSEGVNPQGFGFIYELDFGLRVVSVIPQEGVALARTHEMMEAAGKLDHHLDLARECAALKAAVIVRREGHAGR